jgi:hypothetical protein
VLLPDVEENRSLEESEMLKQRICLGKRASTIFSKGRGFCEKAEGGWTSSYNPASYRCFKRLASSRLMPKELSPLEIFLSRKHQ